MAVNLARTAGVVGRGAVPDLVRAGVTGVALFGVGGFGLTRLLLPAGLRRYEPLWVLPIGACAVALAMTVLGYARIPFPAALALVVAGGVGLAVVAMRRDGSPAITRQAARCAAWPVYVALLLACVSLIPLFRAGFVTVEGQGQDAHLAVGTAEFLQHHGPTEIAPEEPVDRVPLVWRSKPPIYYALGAHAYLAGLDVFQTISTQAAILLALAALGFFVLARELLRAPPWLALVAMALAGLDRMVLHTVMHPYFNQTWGLMTLPFAIVLAWWAVQERTRGGLALLALFLAVGAFAYPLLLPIPLLALVVFLWPERRRLDPRRLYRSRRSLLWMVPLAAALLVPVGGVLEKAASAYNVVFDPTKSLRTWGGDLETFFEEAWFFGIDSGVVLALAAPFLVYGAWLALREVPPRMRKGFVAIFLFALVFAIEFRLRDYGYYFHFKVLAFVAPVALVVAAVGLGRLARPWWLGPAACALLLFSALGSANAELGRTFDQLPRFVLELRSLDRDVPPGKSILIDVDPQEQNWIAYMLHERPLCSRRPLTGTSYPHVQRSRKADYILIKDDAPRPADAVGLPLRHLDAFILYRASPSIPGVDRCSRRMVQTVTTVDAG